MKKRAEDEAATPNAQLKRRFGYLTNALTNSGVLAGTAHKRILIPKDKLTEQDLHTLGFVPVLAAIPEAGQDKFTSYRHPEHNFHVHSHPEGWTMHEDEHPSATMLARKATGAVNKAKAFIGGAPHVSEEGLPGLYYYVKGRLGGHASTAQRVMNELGPDTWKRISRLKPSSTHVVEKEAAARAMRTELEKLALLERLVRLGATDIPKTPRLVMKQRSPGELAGLQRGVEQWWGKNISAPVQRVADKGLNRLPEGKLKNVATQGAKLVAQDPIGTLAVNAIPVPGALPAYLGAKRGLERVIDRVAPMAST